MAAVPTIVARRTVVPHAGILTDAALVFGGALLVAAAAQVQVSLVFTPVPISGQTFAALLVGASLGTVRATSSLALYWVMGLGLPFYAGGESGWSVGTGATGGYLLGFIVAAGLVGWLAERGWDRRFSSSVGAMVTGNLVIYVMGLVWLNRWFASNDLPSSLEATLEGGLYPFVIGDMLKIYLAAALLPLAWRFLGRRHDRSGGA